ncbi:MAG: TolC family protein [bacterium]
MQPAIILFSTHIHIYTHIHLHILMLMLALMSFLLIHEPADGKTGTAVTLSLSDGLNIALQKNTDIRYYLLDKNTADQEVDYQEAVYLPYLKMSSKMGTYSWDVLTAANYRDHHIMDYDLSLSKRHSLAGTSSLHFSTKSDRITYYAPRVHQDEYTSTIFFKYDQPLLKGWGREMADFEIHKAGIRRELAIQKLEDEKNTILFKVFRSYFSLYLTGEELRLKREIRKNTQEIYNVVNEKVKMQKLPITTLNKVQATLLIQDKEIADLENEKRKKEHDLMLSIYNASCNTSYNTSQSDSNTNSDTDPGIILSTQPDSVIASFPSPSWPDTQVRSEKMDFILANYAHQLRLAEKEREKAANNRKPDLTISLEFGIDGYDHQEWSRSIGDISSSNYRALITGVLGLPLKNTAAQADLAAAENKKRQLMIQIGNRREEIKNLVSELRDDMETAGNNMALNEKIAAISKQNLENEIERLVGEKSTVLDTLDYQTAFINAKLALLNTKMDYLMLIGTYYLVRREMQDLISGVRSQESEVGSRKPGENNCLLHYFFLLPGGAIVFDGGCLPQKPLTPALSPKGRGRKSLPSVHSAINPRPVRLDKEIACGIGWGKKAAPPPYICSLAGR